MQHVIDEVHRIGVRRRVRCLEASALIDRNVHYDGTLLHRGVDAPAMEHFVQTTFREPAEWVETIPFTETRGYVQSVMRNADFYRRLYANAPYEASPVVAYKPPAAAPAAAAKKAPVRRKRAASS